MADKEVELQLADGTAIVAMVHDHPTEPELLVYKFEVKGQAHSLVTTTTPEQIAADELKVALAGQYVKGEDAVDASTIAGEFNTAMLAKADAITVRAGDPAIFMCWCSIVHLNNVSKRCERAGIRRHVVYRGKIKLHGTNAAVQLHADGRVLAQSRKRLLDDKVDNAGFCAWVMTQEAAWQQVQRNAAKQVSSMADGVVRKAGCAGGTEVSQIKALYHAG